MEDTYMDREKIEECYKWDLSKIYSSIDDFRSDMQLVKEKMNDFSKYKDMTYDENTLYEVISLYMETSSILNKLDVYTSLLSDEDTGINKNRELKEEVSNLSSEFISKTYFIEPNILKIGYNLIEGYYKKNEKLASKVMERFFKDLEKVESMAE